ncbi:MAG: hypothetical protein GWP91_14230 [Rhodobacterales bacterium]|nr:hypothetical protein [Rhodobacterales bacterium]
MRIAHVTDIHWQVTPTLGEMTPKRILGTANLYLRGRRHHFQPAVQDALVQHLVKLAPDLVLITGDLTAQALSGEFQAAFDALKPVLETLPTFVIPGNHDVYTPEAQKAQRIRELFGPYMGIGEQAMTRIDQGPLTVLGLDPNHPQMLQASGAIPQDQLDDLKAALNEPTLATQTVVLALHYPVLDRHGEIYDGDHHGLRNARALIDVLEGAAKRPDWIVHGHEHHGFTVDLKLSNGAVPIHTCGSSGYAWMPEHKRAAAMNVYTVNDGLTKVVRYLYQGADEGFIPEQGGAYSTGR